MSFTAQDLVRRLGVRRDDLVLATVENTGDETHLVDTALNSYMVEDVSHLNLWVYGSLTADILNRGSEVRALSYDAATYTLTLANPGMPSEITVGIYELRKRAPHNVVLEAINSAIALLDLAWPRAVIDESLTTAQLTQEYALPTGIEWTSVANLKIHLQANMTTDVVGYPFVDATPWNPRVDRAVSAAGAESYTLRFGAQPPIDRTIRLMGDASYTQLVADADVLPLAGAWGQRAFEWIMAYSSYQLDEWSVDRAISGDVKVAQSITGNRLEKQRALLLDTKQSRENSYISVPGVRDGMAMPFRQVLGYPLRP